MRSQVVTLFIGVIFAGYCIAGVVSGIGFLSLCPKSLMGVGAVEVPKQTLERDEFAVMLIMGKNDDPVYLFAF